VLRKIFGLKKGEIIGDGRKLHNEYLHNLSSSVNIIRIKSRMKWAGHAPRMGQKTSSHKVFVENSSEKRTL
jgi:hypothetical protein